MRLLKANGETISFDFNKFRSTGCALSTRVGEAQPGLRCCSYGTPHQDKQVHDANSAANDDDGTWNHERNLGIAAQSRRTVERLLEVWTAGGEGRWVDAIEQREHLLSSPEESQVWWRSEDEDDEE